MSVLVAVFERRGVEKVTPQLLRGMLSATSSPSVAAEDCWAGDRAGVAAQHLRGLPRAESHRQALLPSPDAPVIAVDARLDERDELLRALGLGGGEGATLSDADLVRRAYRRWQTRCVEHLCGAFVVVVWDAARSRLFVARDALGERTVCYRLDAERLLVASEIAPILKHPSVAARINERKVLDYLDLRWHDHEASFYRSIRYLPPGHCLLVTADGHRCWRHWRPEGVAPIRYRSDDEYAAHFLELLRRAVGDRLRGAGTVGVSLSGGLDSSLLAAVAAERLRERAGAGRRLKSFTYTFERLASCDERAYVRPVVERCGLEARFLPADDLWTLQSPASWPVLAEAVHFNPYVRLGEAVREAAAGAGCNALLFGTYGDVLPGGGRFWAADLMRRGRLIRLVRMAAAHPGRVQWRRDLVDAGLRQLPPPGIKAIYRRLRPRSPQPINPAVHAGLRARAGPAADALPTVRPRLFATSLHWARLRGLTSAAFGQGAGIGRRRYEEHGLQPTMPYWDRRLVEFALAVPAEQLGRPERDRWVHRNAMRGLVPRAVRERAGRTVFLPLLRLGLCEREREAVAEMLHDPEVVRRGFVDGGWLRAHPAPACGNADLGHLWLVLSLEMWLRRYW